jgi:hypothetical protein
MRAAARDRGKRREREEGKRGEEKKGFLHL